MSTMSTMSTMNECMYMYVYVCISMYMYVYVCMHLSMHVFINFLYNHSYLKYSYF